MFGEFSPKLPVAQINRPATNYIALCSANQSITGSYVDIGGCSIALDTGTWFITGSVTLLNTVDNDCRVKIYYGSTDLSAAQISLPGGYAGTVAIHTIANILGYQTVKMAAMKAGGTWTIYRYDSVPSNIPGTYITAFRIG